MDGVVPAPECTSLLDLPTEIRIKIYEFLFDGARLSLEGATPESRHCGSPICSCAFPYQILNTCQNLQHEATPYLLAATTLQVRGSLNNIDRLPPRYVSAITRAVVLNVGFLSKTPLDFSKLSGLKTVEFRNITVWCKYHDEAYLASEKGDNCMIALALFNLGRSSRSFTSLCTNETRPFNIIIWCQFVVSSLTDETIVCSSRCFEMMGSIKLT